MKDKVEISRDLLEEAIAVLKTRTNNYGGDYLQRYNSMLSQIQSCLDTKQSNVALFADKTKDSRHLSIKQALESALLDIDRKDGGAFINGKKVLILALDESDGQYQVSFVQAGMKMSECLALCEIGNSIFKSQMNY